LLKHGGLDTEIQTLWRKHKQSIETFLFCQIGFFIFRNGTGSVEFERLNAENLRPRKAMVKDTKRNSRNTFGSEMGIDKVVPKPM